MPKQSTEKDLENNIARFRRTAPKSKMPQGFEIKAVAENVHEVWLHGEVGWDIFAKDFFEQVGPYKAAGNTLRFRGNSPGGDVSEGYAIGNWILEAEANTEFHVEGFIGSIMTYIAACCDKTVMPKNSFQVVHRPSALMVGTAEAMRVQADALSKIAEQMLTIYEAKQSRTLGETDGAESIREIMWAEEDVLLSADECAALGLADEIIDEIKVTACVRSDVVDRFRASIPDELIISDELDDKEGEDEANQSSEPDATIEETPSGDPDPSSDEPDPTPETDVDPEDEDLPEEAQAEIRAACEVLDMPEKADEFISAKASLSDVKKALWKARVALDEEIVTDPTPPVSEDEEEGSYQNRADKARANFTAAWTR